MGNVDDLLFAPIQPEAQKVAYVDFLVRTNAVYKSFDWKPVSRRAHNWMHKHFTWEYETSQVLDGWMSHFSTNADGMDGTTWGQELIDQKFNFEQV